jgi:hypothetical protein
MPDYLPDALRRPLARCCELSLLSGKRQKRSTFNAQRSMIRTVSELKRSALNVER